MRICLLLSFLLSFSFPTAYAQNCFPEKRKEKQLLRKIQKQIEKRAFYAALDMLRNTNNYAVFYVLKSEILWLRGDFFNAEKEALKAIDICLDNFPKAYYFLGEIALALFSKRSM